MDGARAVTERCDERSEEHHMHWKLRYGTLLMVPQAGTLKGAPNWGPLSMVQSDVKLFE